MTIEEEIARTLAENWRNMHTNEALGFQRMLAHSLSPLLNRVRAEALKAFANELRARYPDDVFRPLAGAEHRSVNDAMAGRVERTHVTRDRVSADMMRRAAAQADDYAMELIEQSSEGNDT